MPHLIWFKQDLRVHDNPALYNACQHAEDGVVALYLITPQMWQDHDDAPIKIEFWRRNLVTLQHDLAALNIPLLIETVQYDADKTILTLCQQHNISHVFFNKNYEWNEAQRDKAVEKLLTYHNIECSIFNDQCIIEPGKLPNKQGAPYTVFTPFKKAWLECVDAAALKVFPKPKKQLQLTIKAGKIPEKISGFEYDLNEKYWAIGEDAALKQLKKFITQHAYDYQKLRDFPFDDTTSKLSPYLTAGVLSVKQCLIAAANENDGSLSAHNAGIAIWISELIWREFYRHIMVAFPRVCKHQPFQEKTKKLRWHHSEKLLTAWQEGNTGIPIVDAAMRQLNTTGWMHNRLRMVTAMFLTKNLFIDWRIGEKYFMQQLIDGDLASNNGGWQWSASTGTDAAPYFRIMNPVSQSERFDPEGKFIRLYCPELAELDNDSIHNPHELAPLLMNNIDYPEPIVDLKTSRTAAIEKFKAL